MNEQLYVIDWDGIYSIIIKTNRTKEEGGMSFAMAKKELIKYFKDIIYDNRLGLARAKTLDEQNIGGHE